MTRSGTCEDILGMTRWFEENIGRPAEDFQDWDQKRKNRRREARWYNSQYVLQTVGKAGRQGVAYFLVLLQLASTYQRMTSRGSTVQEGTAGEKANKRMTGVWCANCGQQHRKHEYGCVITV